MSKYTTKLHAMLFKYNGSLLLVTVFVSMDDKLKFKFNIFCITFSLYRDASLNIYNRTGKTGPLTSGH